MRLLRVPGVYGPGSDSRLLAAAIPGQVRPTDRVLDVFTGSGVQAVTAARAGAAEVLAVDVSRRAMLSVALNSRLNGVRIEARRGCMFEPVVGMRFDLILANPPFVPGEEGDAGPRGDSRAWEAGPDGRKFLDPFLLEVSGYLTPGGRVLLVQSSISDTDRTIEALSEAGMTASVVSRQEHPLGPVTAPRAEALEARGVLRPGQRTEETVVIHGAIAAPAAIGTEPAVSAVAA